MGSPAQDAFEEQASAHLVAVKTFVGQHQPRIGDRERHQVIDSFVVRRFPPVRMKPSGEALAALHAPARDAGLDTAHTTFMLAGRHCVKPNWTGAPPDAAAQATA